MRNIEDIKKRLAVVEEKLDVIDHAIQKEMHHPFFERDVEKCRFLDLEKKIYAAVQAELNWIIHA